MGAWIETNIETAKNYNVASHPTWVRGLKLHCLGCFDTSKESHPTWVRGLKLCLSFLMMAHITSHPTWVRGLKLLISYRLAMWNCWLLPGVVDLNSERTLNLRSAMFGTPLGLVD